MESQAKELKEEEKQHLLKEQLKKWEERLKILKEQYDDVILAEENAAEKEFLEQQKAFEAIRLGFLQIEENRNRAKKRWDEAQKESKIFLKQIQSVKNEIIKTRKKLDLPDLEPESNIEQKGFIIFKKDRFPKEDEKGEESGEPE